MHDYCWPYQREIGEMRENVAEIRIQHIIIPIYSYFC